MIIMLTLKHLNKMINYTKIVVFENDSEFQGLPYIMNILQSNETVKFDVMWNFSNLFLQKNIEETFKKLSEIDNTNTICLANPSFVGAGNSLENYFTIFLKLKELNVKLNLAIIYNEGFFIKLLKFLYKEDNYLKKQNNHRILKEILDFHDIYELDSSDINLKKAKISETYKKVNFDDLLKYYVESHRKLERTKFKIKSSGEVYNCVYVNHHIDNLDELKVTLEIPNDYNNSYFLNELERLN